jgi:hypothetical protein
MGRGLGPYRPDSVVKRACPGLDFSAVLARDTPGGQCAGRGATARNSRFEWDLPSRGLRYSGSKSRAHTTAPSSISPTAVICAAVTAFASVTNATAGRSRPRSCCGDSKRCAIGTISAPWGGVGGGSRWCVPKCSWRARQTRWLSSPKSIARMRWRFPDGILDSAPAVAVLTRVGGTDRHAARARDRFPNRRPVLRHVRPDELSVVHSPTERHTFRAMARNHNRWRDSNTTCAPKNRCDLGESTCSEHIMSCLFWSASARASKV